MPNFTLFGSFYVILGLAAQMAANLVKFNHARSKRGPSRIDCFDQNEYRPIRTALYLPLLVFPDSFI